MNIRLNFKFLLPFVLLCLGVPSCSKDSSNDSATGEAKDVDGNVYKTIKIGNKIWMTENLKVTHYRNGDPIPKITDINEWINNLKGGYCTFNNDPINNVIYGQLYNAFAVEDNRNIAPSGWHVATKKDWDELVQYAGGPAIAGGMLKQKGFILWLAPNTGATDAFGFEGLPGGVRLTTGEFSAFLGTGIWWTSTFEGPFTYWYRMHYNLESMDSNYDNKNSACSIRCVKD